MAEPTAQDPIDAAWVTLLDQWSDPERHRRFVALARTLDRLPDAARRYRAVADDPARSERARDALDQILKVAMLSLTQVRREPAPPRFRYVIPVGVAMLAVVALMFLSRALEVPALASPWALLGVAVIALVFPWHKLLPRPS